MLTAEAILSRQLHAMSWPRSQSGSTETRLVKAVAALLYSVMEVGGKE